MNTATSPQPRTPGAIFRSLAHNLDGFCRAVDRSIDVGLPIQQVSAATLILRLEQGRAHRTLSYHRQLDAPPGGRLILPQDLPGTIWQMTAEEWETFDAEFDRRSEAARSAKGGAK